MSGSTLGADDGICETSPDGAHEFDRATFVVNARGQLDGEWTCVRCPAVVYAAEVDDRRPPL